MTKETRPGISWSAVVLVLAAMALGGAVQPATAQDEEETEEKSALEIEAEEAKLQAEIQEAKLNAAKFKKELEELKYPSSDFAPETPGISRKDKAGYYGELLSFQTLDAAAFAFVDTVSGLEVNGNRVVPSGSRVIVTSDFELSKVGALNHLVDGKLTELGDEFPLRFLEVPTYDPDKADEQIEAAGLAAIPLLTSGLGAISELAAFFRVKRELGGLEIEPSSPALVALVVKHLGADFEPRLPALIMKYDTKLAKRIDDVKKLERDAGERRKAAKGTLKAPPIGIDIDKAAAEIADIKKKLEDNPDDAALKERLRKLEFYKSWWDDESRMLAAAADALEKLMTRLEKVPDKATQAPLEMLYAYEALTEGEAFILVAQAVSQGGDVETSSGALRKTKISYVGGSACLFYLSDLEGNVLEADVIPVMASETFTGRIGTQPPTRLW